MCVAKERFRSQLGALVCSNRKKIEQGVCESRARNTRRPYNARAKMLGWIARLFFETPKTNYLQRQLRSKSALENPKMDVQSDAGKPKNDKKSTKFRSRALWGARDRSGDGAGTCWGRLWGANKPPRDRSWVARSGPRACGKRPKAFPGRSRDAPGRPRSSA